MTRLAATGALLAVLGWVGVASADVIDECPDGTRQVIRQGSNGHHGGYECVEEEGCTTSGTRTAGTAVAGALGAIAIGLALRSRRR